MRRIGRFAVLAVAATALLVAGASPALAVIKDGTRSCGAGKAPVARTYATGQFKLLGPGDSGYTFYDLPSWSIRTNSGPGGYWAVDLWGPGGVDAAETYAYCAGG